MTDRQSIAYWAGFYRQAPAHWRFGLVLLWLPVAGAKFWLGDESASLVAVFLMPLLLAFIPARPTLFSPREVDTLTGLALRSSLARDLDRMIRTAARQGHETGAVILEIDGFKSLEQRFEHAVIEQILRTCANRLSTALRDKDVVARLEGPCFGVALDPARNLDLAAAILLAGRLQSTLTQPIRIGSRRIYITVSVGFALAARADRIATAESLLQSANAAAIEALRHGPSAIRSYSAVMQARIAHTDILGQEVGQALETGQILPFFQPQVSARTGRVTGVETLARWDHPERGFVPPDEFLPALEEAGLMARLGEIMLTRALQALREWDACGFDVPGVSVNFSSPELVDPGLVGRIGQQLDQHGIAPHRLVVEVLETVVARGEDDIIYNNLSGLSHLGCCLDLDDFGTGNASITSIRRFSIERIKIDRSFVTRIDEDVEQQKMVYAILTMAERLGIDTLAEGVETTGEQDMLVRLGVGHLQGYRIARPLALQDVNAWLRARALADRPPARTALRAV